MSAADGAEALGVGASCLIGATMTAVFACLAGSGATHAHDAWTAASCWIIFGTLALLTVLCLVIGVAGVVLAFRGDK